MGRPLSVGAVLAGVAVCGCDAPTTGTETETEMATRGHLLGDTRPPHQAHAPAELPKTHVADSKPWECLSRDECYFPRMPFYSQTNPNLARVDIPKEMYDADAHKLKGPIVWDEAAKRDALVLDPKGSKTNDPYYRSWLPYGPVSKEDDGYIGYWYSGLCGAASGAMAMMAAIAAKSPSTRIKPDSWTMTSLVQARRPDEQTPFPNPLLTDHTTRAPGHRQMTEKQLQRLVNVAVREGTSPVAGGGADTMLHIADDFELVGGKSPVHTRTASDGVTGAMLANAIRDGFAPILVVTGYKASLTPVRRDGRLVRYTLTFRDVSGHLFAVNGFSPGPRNHPSFLVYDPVYAKPVRKVIVRMPLANAKKDGVPVEITPPFGDRPKFIPVMHDVDGSNAKPIARVEDLTDGAEIEVPRIYNALKID